MCVCILYVGHCFYIVFHKKYIYRYYHLFLCTIDNPTAVPYTATIFKARPSLTNFPNGTKSSPVFFARS